MRHKERVEIDVGTAIIIVSKRTYDRLLKMIPLPLLNDLAWWQRQRQGIAFEVRWKRQEEESHGQEPGAPSL